MRAVQPSYGRPDWSGRLGELGNTVSALALDALVVSAPANLRYLTGFAGSSGLLVVGRGVAMLLVDGRYERPARSAIAAGEVARVDVQLVPGPYAEALGQAIRRSALRRVGFEAASVTVATLSSWQGQSGPVDWIRTDRLVENLRLVKDEYERAVFRRAGRMLSDVAARLGEFVGEGRTEIAVARSIDQALEDIGFSGPAFPTIVASGPASASPHARPTARRLGPGELVVLDFGGVLDGYCVDLSRMAAVGRVGPEALRLFEAVRDAQRAALGVVRAGVPAGTVDEAARRTLSERGLGEAFLHATGHGLGLDVHEAPRIGRPGTSDPPEVLAAGMVCTIEPGAYVEGLGGARLEDDVLVTPNGYEALTTAPTDLLAV
jgi:Xaa-Pro aminopeptidase